MSSSKPTTMNPLTWWFQRNLSVQIFIALIIGVICGMIFGRGMQVLQPLGVMFLHAIQMMVVPVVFTLIVSAIISFDNIERIGRVVTKTLLLYIVCMLIAAIIGISCALIIKPGVGMQLNIASHISYHTPPHLSFAQKIENFIPTSAIQAFASNNVIQILVFAIVLGVAIRLSGKAANPVTEVFLAFRQVAFKFAEIIMFFAPYGIFALTATIFGQFGLKALIPLLKFVMTVYVACLLQCLLVYCSGLLLIKMNPLRFFRKISRAIIVAYTTSSSVATLPVTLRCAEEELGLSKELSSFLLPLGTSFNLNGLSIYLSVATVFAANLYGMHLSYAILATMVFTIVITAVGAAAVPASGLILMSVVMHAVGIPLGGLSFIAGVDRLNDMAQTTTNVIGDLFATTVIAKTTKSTE